MPHIPDSAILAALRANGGDHRAVALDLGVPLRRVARIASHGESAHDPKRPPPPMRVPNLHPDEAKLDSPYGPYWRQFGLAPVQVVRPKRTARMVPDDRESWDFDMLLDVTATALSRAPRDEGRGAA